MTQTVCKFSNLYQQVCAFLGHFLLHICWSLFPFLFSLRLVEVRKTKIPHLCRATQNICSRIHNRNGGLRKFTFGVLVGTISESIVSKNSSGSLVMFSWKNCSSDWNSSLTVGISVSISTNPSAETIGKSNCSSFPAPNGICGSKVGTGSKIWRINSSMSLKSNVLLCLLGCYSGCCTVCWINMRDLTCEMETSFSMGIEFENGMQRKTSRIRWIDLLLNLFMIRIYKWVERAGVHSEATNDCGSVLSKWRVDASV